MHTTTLFTPRFLTMTAYSFTVFVSVFQLLPTAPYHILDLGGSTAAAGLFLGLLTYSSALSAPFTGSIGDRVGQRRVLIVVSLLLAAFTASYAVIGSYRLMLVVVVVHGLFWSALLSASGAYMTATIPPSRRAEGLGYWGLASVLAVATAPSIGFWVYRHGWITLCIELTVLNLVMAAIAMRLPDDRASHAATGTPPEVRRALQEASSAVHDARPAPHVARTLSFTVEWRVMILSVTMALISFGYGSLTSFSALFADALAVTPRSLFLSAMAVSILVGRLTIGRSLDRLGHRRVLVRSLLAPPAGLGLLALAQGEISFLVAALVFGAGFGLMYPAFTAYVMEHVPATRRGAAFGAMLAAFDTGIGTGSSALGWLVQQAGFRYAFGAAAGVAMLSLPMFLIAERRLGFAAATAEARTR
jgi:MFS family permease